MVKKTKTKSESVFLDKYSCFVGSLLILMIITNILVGVAFEGHQKSINSAMPFMILLSSVGTIGSLVGIFRKGGVRKRIIMGLFALVFMYYLGAYLYIYMHSVAPRLTY